MKKIKADKKVYEMLKDRSDLVKYEAILKSGDTAWFYATDFDSIDGYFYFYLGDSLSFVVEADQIIYIVATAIGEPEPYKEVEE